MPLSGERMENKDLIKKLCVEQDKRRWRRLPGMRLMAAAHAALKEKRSGTVESITNSSLMAGTRAGAAALGGTLRA